MVLVYGSVGSFGYEESDIYAMRFNVNSRRFVSLMD